jgi:hypothetical protein
MNVRVIQSIKDLSDEELERIASGAEGATLEGQVEQDDEPEEAAE